MNYTKYLGMTQPQRVLAYIDEFGSITQIEAFVRLGIVRLPSRIHDFKKDGIDIKREWIRGKNRFGEPIRIVKYSREVQNVDS